VEDLLEGIGELGCPYNTAVLFCAFVVALTFIVSTLSCNYSQVDKLWSIVPAVYTWIAVCDARTLLMACLSTIWAIRLTWNFNRRGGYKWPPWDGDEDYRWKQIQEGRFLTIMTNPVVWHLFNFGFISVYQNIILLLIACPSFVAYTASKECAGRSQHQLVALDWAAASMFLLFVVIESIADNQQYAFQIEKYRLKDKGEPLAGEYADGFKQSGLFAFVRKPNYAAEQAIWVTFYLFSIAATGNLWNWSAIGMILLILLFQMSGWFTELLTLSKYPKYAEYMKRVPLFLPNSFLSSTKKKVQ